MLELTIKQRLALAVLLVFLALGGTVLFLTENRRDSDLYRLDASSDRIYVHVCGAVIKAGVIKLKPATRTFEALRLAGGTLPEADLNRINLAAFVEDGAQIYVPRKGEPLPIQTRRGSTTRIKPDKSAARKNTGPSIPRSPVDLNLASQSQLEAIPGIGPVLAERILKCRKEQGKFKAYEDLNKVNGIGPKKLEQLRPYLFVK